MVLVKFSRLPIILLNSALLAQIVLSENLSQLGRYQLKESHLPQVSLGSSKSDSEKIDLVKRMLYKTRHIKRQNDRNRRAKGRKDDSQGSMELNPRVLQKASTNDGKQEKNQAPSLTSNNNFINFCISDFARGSVFMNGAQTKKKAACNPIPMGMVPSQDHLPSCKIVVPKNLDTIKADTTFRVDVNIKNLVVGVFTNPQKTFMAAPAQIDHETGDMFGHSHLVIQALDSLESTTVPDPLAFFFFKGIDDAAKNGIVSVEIKDGLPPGVWRLSTINTASNHQPIGSTVAQHGPFDDIIYITAK